MSDDAARLRAKLGLLCESWMTNERGPRSIHDLARAAARLGIEHASEYVTARSAGLSWEQDSAYFVEQIRDVSRDLKDPDQ